MGKIKPAVERKRNNLTFRTRDHLRDQLQTAAKLTGRSISEEIEYRLIASLGGRQTVLSPREKATIDDRLDKISAQLEEVNARLESLQWQQQSKSRRHPW